MRWVRPDLTTSANSSAFAARERSSCSRDGSSRSLATPSAARCTALGKTSLEDWPMFTWSLGWAPSPASVAMTSLAFMFEEVPEPVWKTSIGNWSSWRPSAISSAAAAIRFARSASSSPRSALARAAAPLMRPSQRTTSTGTRSPETGKLSTALRVSMPQSSFGVSSTVMALLAFAWSAGGNGRARARLGRDLARVQRLAAVAAHERRLGVVAALLVEQQQRGAGLVGEGLVAPAHDRHDGGIEVAAHRRELVLEALGLLLVADPVEDPGAGERLEARGEDVAGDAEVALELGEPADAEEGLAHDQEGPALTEDLHRAADRTGLV